MEGIIVALSDILSFCQIEAALPWVKIVPAGALRFSRERQVLNPQATTHVHRSFLFSCQPRNYGTIPAICRRRSLPALIAEVFAAIDSLMPRIQRSLLRKRPKQL